MAVFLVTINGYFLTKLTKLEVFRAVFYQKCLNLVVFFRDFKRNTADTRFPVPVRIVIKTAKRDWF